MFIDLFQQFKLKHLINGAIEFTSRWFATDAFPVAFRIFMNVYKYSDAKIPAVLPLSNALKNVTLTSYRPKLRFDNSLQEFPFYALSFFEISCQKLIS